MPLLYATLAKDVMRSKAVKHGQDALFDSLQSHMDVDTKSKLCIWFVMFTFGRLCIGPTDVTVKLTASHASRTAASENRPLYTLINAQVIWFPAGIR